MHFLDGCDRESGTLMANVHFREHLVRFQNLKRQQLIKGLDVFEIHEIPAGFLVARPRVVIFILGFKLSRIRIGG